LPSPMLHAIASQRQLRKHIQREYCSMPFGFDLITRIKSGQPLEMRSNRKNDKIQCDSSYLVVVSQT
jgi:hypothetical protein